MHYNFLITGLSIAYFSLFFNPLFAQVSEVKVAAKLTSSTQTEQLLSFQSIDGSANCNGQMVYNYSGEELKAIQFSINGCEGILPDLDKSISASGLSTKDMGIFEVSNNEYSLYISDVNGTYYLEKIVSSDTNNPKIWMFVYNNYLVSIPKNIPTNTVGNKSVSSTSETFEYTVKKGEYIYQLARKYKCSPTELLRLNDLKATDVLIPGQKIMICKSVNQVSEPIITKEPVKKGKTIPTNPKVNNPVAKNNDSKELETLKRENVSLTIYGEEMKEEYELIVKEYGVLKRSYDALSSEYKSIVMSNTELNNQIFELRELLDQNGIAYDKKEDENSLTPEETQRLNELKAKIIETKQQLLTVQETVKEERTKSLDSTQIVSNEVPLSKSDQEKANKTAKIKEEVFSSQKDQSIKNPIEFSEISNEILLKAIAIEDFKQAAVEKRLKFVLSNNIVKRIEPLDSVISPSSDMGDSKINDFITNENIEDFKRVQFDFKDRSPYKVIRFFVEITPVFYQVKHLKNGGYLLAKTSEKGVDEIASGSVLEQAISDYINSNGITKSKVKVSFTKGSFSLKSISDAGGYEVHKETILYLAD